MLKIWLERNRRQCRPGDLHPPRVLLDLARGTERRKALMAVDSVFLK
jgi:hypothetical protein